MARPKQLKYAANERPALLVSLLLGMQYLILALMWSLLTVLIAREAHASAKVVASVVSITLLVSAIATLLQSAKPPFGSGQLLPLTSNPAYFAPSMIAAKIGGLPLVYGMTLFSGIIQLCFSPFLKHMQRLFPAAISGLIIALIGVGMGKFGVNNLMLIFDKACLPGPHNFLPIIIGSLAALVMVAIIIWGTPLMNRFGLLIVVLVAYVILYVLHSIPVVTLTAIKHTPWFGYPSVTIFHAGLTFNSSLVIPFIIAAFVCVLKVIGSVSVMEKLEDDEWQAPDMRQVSFACMSDSIATILSGMFGGTGLNVSSSCLAVSRSSWVASRFLALVFAVFVGVLAFCAKLTAIFIFMPKVLLAATMVALGFMLVFEGVNILATYLHQRNTMYVVGLAFIIGLSHDVFPIFYNDLHGIAHYFTGSMIALGSVSAVILNFIFNLRGTEKD